MGRNYQREFEAYLARQREARTDAFCEFSPLIVLGEPLHCFTLHHWTLLDLIDSPLLLACGIDPGDEALIERLCREWLEVNPAQLGLSLWLLSDEYFHRHRTPGDRPLAWHQDRFIRRVGERLTDDLLKEAAALVWRHVHGAFFDAPPPSRRRGSGSGVPLACPAAEIIHSVATQYGWSAAEIRFGMPLAQLWQFVRLIAKSADPERHVIQRSDIFRGHLQSEYELEMAAWERRQRRPPIIEPITDFHALMRN